MNEIKAHNTMSPEQQDIAVFESLGWKYLPPVKRDSSFIVRPENLPRWKKGREIAYKGDIPSYGTDLNACREFEEVLNSPKYMQFHAFNKYAAMLCEMCKHEYNAIAAKAPQRCEAFLKTIKWVSASLKPQNQNHD